MFKYFILFIWCVSVYPLYAQPLSSRDIRHASGKGPYPVYVNFQISTASMKSTLHDFINDYAAYRQSDFPNLKKFKALRGFEGNLGVVINTDHFLGVTGFRINRAALEFGYRYLHRDLHHNGEKPLHLREDVASIRVGMRGNLLYPVTYQLQAGPIVFHHTEVIDEVVRVVNLRTAPFPAGWDLRARLMLFDPAGTAGGLGAYFECRYLITSKGRDLSVLYQDILGDTSNRSVHKSWNYASWSVGIVVPLAMRWL